MLAAAGVFIASAVAINIQNSLQEAGIGSAATGDAATFQEIVARMKTGTDYYDAAAAVLRSREYPVASIFNWREPLLYKGIAALSEIGSHGPPVGDRCIPAVPCALAT